jgi:hypothetical protein
MSVKCGVAFVAGLIEDPSYRELGYSSTYVIDAGVHELLSRKMKPDTSGLYKPCASNYDKPLFHRGICIAALICVDGLMFNHNVPSDRQSALLQRINACNAARKVLCIPAHADEYDTRAVACNWFLAASLNVVVANSSPLQPSVIQNGGKVDDESRCAGQGNEVRFAALA